MTTEAQIQANRLNAEKSTGPRTPEGKEKASQNSLKHGLFAREGVIRGEDWEEFEMHRERLLEELAPNGSLEVILASRVVDLTWRLQRAGQNQNEVFGALYDRYLARQAEPAAGADGGTGPGDAPDTITAAERGRLLGRMILEDFENEAILERLQRYERRIESSFYRTLTELRRLHDRRCKAEPDVAETLARWREEDWQARKAGMFACPPPMNVAPDPAGGTTNTPGHDDFGLRISDCGLKDDGPEQPRVALVPDEGGLTDETCKTNPISEGVPSWKCEVPGELCKTNPIPEGVSSWKCEVSSETCKTNPIPPDPGPSRGLVGSAR